MKFFAILAAVLALPGGSWSQPASVIYKDPGVVVTKIPLWDDVHLPFNNEEYTNWSRQITTFAGMNGWIKVFAPHLYPNVLVRINKIMPSRVEKSEIFIDADIQKCWQILSDKSTWQRWNKWESFSEKIDFRITEKPMRGTLLMSWDGDQVWKEKHTSTVTITPQEYKISWSSKIPLLLDTIHYMKLTADGKRTRLDNDEIWNGLLPAWNLGFNWDGCKAMNSSVNEAFKNNVEDLAYTSKL